jgi:hypothetical protein
MTLRLRWISDRHARTLRRSLLILLLALLLPQLAAADGVFTQRARYDGTYGMITGGVGLSIVMPGDIVLNVPGPVVQAYLYWAGQDLDPGGDSSVGLSVNSGPVNTINADRSYGPDYWNGSVSSPPIRYNYVWVADVTSLILAGSNTYTISGFGPMYLEYGAGLVVVYQDGALPYGFVEVVEGLDGAYFNYTSPRGPNTEVSCVQFAAEASPRTMDISFFVGGVDVSGGPASARFPPTL